ncbi:unnamed protein product [Ilex paraguariensis]|uniref:B box-type domain-containing protein n=1 Tax=Ilex paraguariensis TaxID=185542 RepID=A0ABC8RJL8_9AQUA
MISPKRRDRETVPCDFCHEQIAILYCRADSAKLCLFCDQQVHSANALSRKHLRSQICDNCGSEPVSVRCSTDNLVLCQECDWDAHGSCSVSAAHDRNPIEGFSGCPSALELAMAWGFDIEDKKPQFNLESVSNWAFQESINNLNGDGHIDSWMYKAIPPVTMQDLMVPNENGGIYGSENLGEMVKGLKRQSLTCGKQKQVILRQLMELYKSDLVDGGGGGFGGGGGGGEDLVPGTPHRRGCGWQGNVEGCGLEDVGAGDANVANQSVQRQLQPQQNTPFTSLLMMNSQVDFKGSDRIIDGDMLWDSKPIDHRTQIWDFNLGRLRDHEESGSLEAEYGGSDSVFMMKSYGELLKEASLETTKGLGEIYKMNSSTAHADITAFNVSHFDSGDR